MSFRLSDLKEYSDIVIQCHDNPDADALASGFALKWYLDKCGVPSRFVYGGQNEVRKSNLVLMISRLKIEIEHVSEIKRPQLLILVDCQYGQSNAQKFEADNVIVIDHHQISGPLPEIYDIRSNYGACATILYDLLTKENIDINSDTALATALYYGLMTDTNNFSEISHPIDKDLRDFSKFNSAEITLYKNSNISIEELKIAGDALQKTICNNMNAYGIVEAEPCDPNILGLISDMLLEVDIIGACLVYSILPFGVKISVRSCIREVKASELACFIAEGYGGGGGHLIKAGGFLQKELLEAGGIEYTKESIDAFIKKRMDLYYSSTEILYAGKTEEDVSKMEHYRKKPVPLGFVRTTDLAPEGTRILVRTLEGDVHIDIVKDVYIIIGIKGEIWPIKKAKFEASYNVPDTEYTFTGEYPPTVIDIENSKRLDLLPFAKSCIASGGTGIYVRKLDHRVKLFTAWDPDKYYLGVEGDYLAARDDDPSDIYVIAQGIFPLTYEKG